MNILLQRTIGTFLLTASIPAGIFMFFIVAIPFLFAESNCYDPSECTTIFYIFIAFEALYMFSAFALFFIPGLYVVDKEFRLVMQKYKSIFILLWVIPFLLIIATSWKIFLD